MSSKMTVTWLRRTLFAVVAFVFLATALFLGSFDQQVEASSANATKAAATTAVGGTTFPGTNTGAIPDRGVAGCGAPAGSPRDVTFAVSGLSGAPTEVTVNMNVTHSWVGDLNATLIAPNSTQHVLFGRTGATTATACGASTDLLGVYNFTDAAMGANWWTAAATNPVPAGDYRTTTPGGGAGGGVVTNLSAAFAGVADPNGTWTLRVTDFGGGDTGSVSAANLTITAGSAPSGDGIVDFDGDGRTDWTVVRNVGGGANGQVRWFINLAAGGGTQGFDWGLASDFFTPADFDGDGNDDIATWRPNGVDSTFYILNSATNTARVETFGITGDNPAIVGDYNGDGTADLAVYRPGATPGAQSFFFYRTTPGGPIAFEPWGTNGDFVAIGDYDGNGRMDFGVQRASGGSGVFWIRLNGAPGTIVEQFGLSTDLIVPGDYDGDGATDIAVGRNEGGARAWYFRPSSNPGAGAVRVQWGLATDFITPGDYNGDGTTDLGIWRDGTFWVFNPVTSAVTTFQLGSPGDYPVANFQVQ